MSDKIDNAAEVAYQRVEVPPDPGLYQILRHAAFRYGGRVKFDQSIMFSSDYDFEGMEHLRQELITDWGGYLVWPNQLGGKKKWSTYCDRDGGLMFEKFDSPESAKDWCVRDIAYASEVDRIPPQGEQVEPSKENIEMTDDDKKERGLYQKFVVVRTDGKSGVGQKHHGCRYFVLDMDHDKFAPPAIAAYAKACADEYSNLAFDLNGWLAARGHPQGEQPPTAPDNVVVSRKLLMAMSVTLSGIVSPAAVKVKERIDQLLKGPTDEQA